MKQFTLLREQQHLTCTIGRLMIGGEFFCHTLEDVDRQVIGEPVERWKVKGKTAIPTGVYRLVLTFSPRFRTHVPLLQNVPGFEGVRVHPGNTADDTEGCILLGDAVAPAGEALLNSRPAYNRFLDIVLRTSAHKETMLFDVSRNYT